MKLNCPLFSSCFNRWSVDEVFSSNNVGEEKVKSIISLAGTLGNDPTVKTRDKSIAFFMLGSDLKFRKLSQHMFIQAKLYNDNPIQGGVTREYPQLPDECTNSPEFLYVLNVFRMKFSIQPGTVVLCQIQTTTEHSDISSSDVTEQGIHTDGADVAMILCLERKNCTGAKNTLFADRHGHQMIMPPTILQKGEALFWKDGKIYHDVSFIRCHDVNKGPAVRTVMLLHAHAVCYLDGTHNPNNKLNEEKWHDEEYHPRHQKKNWKARIDCSECESP